MPSDPQTTNVRSFDLDTRETAVIEVQQWQHIRRPVVRTSGGVFMLDHPKWLVHAGRRAVVRYCGGDQFATVERFLDDPQGRP